MAEHSFFQMLAACLSGWSNSYKLKLNSKSKDLLCYRKHKEIEIVPKQYTENESFVWNPS